MAQKTLLFIFHAHTPYIRNEHPTDSPEEMRFFELVSYGLLPFLRMCMRLESEHIPFKCGLVLSPTLCEMLTDPLIQEQYSVLLDKHIAFGQAALARTTDSKRRSLIKMHLSFLQVNRNDFIIAYKKNILKKITELLSAGVVELLATAATFCFFPFYENMPESIAAQIDLGLACFREYFPVVPSGFWLPAMGYNTGIDPILKSFGIDYTVVESQSFLFADHPPNRGVFAPAVSESGLIFFGKDCMAGKDVMHSEAGFYRHACYLDTDRDIGFELSGQELRMLFPVEKGRRATGFCYNRRNGDMPYNGAEAAAQAEKDAEVFLQNRYAVLSKAAELTHNQPLCSVCALPLHFLGKTWFEGMTWLEYVFRKLAQTKELHIALPSAYLRKATQLSNVTPFYGSTLPSGYADELINSSNDWMFPLIQKATERMIDLAARFSEDSGLMERVLNTAAKEVLFAQSMDWPLMVDSFTSADYAVTRCEEHIQAFSTVYEALGTKAVSTDWLIKREKKYPVFSEMDYRFFLKRNT